MDAVLPKFGLDPFTQQQNLSAEFHRLLSCTLSQLRAADPLGKTQEILNKRGRVGLPADHFPLDEHSPQALGRAVNRRAQAGGSGPIYGKIVFPQARLRHPAEALRRTVGAKSCTPSSSW